MFYLALKSLPKTDRDAVLVRIVHDQEFFQDMLDLLVIEKRRNEPSRLFRDFLADRKR